MGLARLSSNEGDQNEFSIEYTSWLVEHPCALDKFKEMKSIAKGKKIVIFLDYDGTLSEIVPNPEEAFMTDKMRMVLGEVADRFPTAIISGRKREKVQDFVQLKNVYYAGSHGLDIEAPLNSLKCKDSNEMDNKIVLYQPAKEFLPEKDKVLNLLSERTKDIKGVNIEDNKFCISIHFRHVHSKDLGTVENVISVILKEYPNFLVSTGKKEIFLSFNPPFTCSNSDAMLLFYVNSDAEQLHCFRNVASLQNWCTGFCYLIELMHWLNKQMQPFNKRHTDSWKDMIVHERMESLMNRHEFTAKVQPLE
ncbi:putative trehalose-phosphate phosphatase 6 [Capsicum annuum]|nr:putative trehalose-phosphate phosphatase 6 [Capsicum annuum]